MYSIDLNLPAYTFKLNTNLQKANGFILRIYAWVRFVHEKVVKTAKNARRGTVSVLTSSPLVLH